MLSLPLPLCWRKLWIHIVSFPCFFSSSLSQVFFPMSSPCFSFQLLSLCSLSSSSILVTACIHVIVSAPWFSFCMHVMSLLFAFLILPISNNILRSLSSKVSSPCFSFSSLSLCFPPSCLGDSFHDFIIVSSPCFLLILFISSLCSLSLLLSLTLFSPSHLNLVEPMLIFFLSHCMSPACVRPTLPLRLLDLCNPKIMPLHRSNLMHSTANRYPCSFNRLCCCGSSNAAPNFSLLWLL